MVTHKELLTFSNLTNLEWEFVELYDNETGRKKDNTFLRDLLDPENFVREETDPETGKKRTIQVYGEGEQGLFEMRQKAGIAMEYLEKLEAGNNEGAFLRDWEVIYGGDKYKILEEYLIEVETAIRALLDTYLTEDQFSSKEEYEKYKNSRIYPSREYFEKMNKKEEELLKIKLVIDLAKRGFSILTASSLLEKTFFELSVETGVQLLNTALGKYASEIGPVICFLLKALKDPVGFMKIIRSVDSKTIAKLIIGEMEEEENHQLYEEIKDILNDVDEGEIEFVEEINMYDEGRYKEGIDEFRVLVLKKGDDIVIAYKGRKVENKNLLPDEMECLQLVYSRITLEYPDMSIHFTGCNGGGERAFINSLLLGADRCYIVESEDNLSKISEKLFNNKDAWKDNIFEKLS